MTLNGVKITSLSHLNSLISDLNIESKTHLINTYLNELSETESREIDLATRKREYGTYISQELTDLLGARNKILGLTSQQITSMLSTLMPIKTLLETGGLGTARTYIIQLQSSFPQHADIFQDGVDDINEFEQMYGL